MLLFLLVVTLQLQVRGLHRGLRGNRGISLLTHVIIPQPTFSHLLPQLSNFGFEVCRALLSSIRPNGSVEARYFRGFVRIFCCRNLTPLGFQFPHPVRLCLS